MEQVVTFDMIKGEGKNLIILRMERAFKMKLKAFFTIFKELSLKQTKIVFGGGESPIFKVIKIISFFNLTDGTNSL